MTYKCATRVKTYFASTALTNAEKENVLPVNKCLNQVNRRGTSKKFSVYFKLSANDQPAMRYLHTRMREIIFMISKSPSVLSFVPTFDNVK